MNAQIRIPVAQIKVERARSQSIVWTWCHSIGELCVNLWLSCDHRWGRRPAGPLRFAPDRVGSRFVKSVTADGDTVAHGRPARLNMVQIPGDRIYMDVTRNQPRARFDASRQQPRMNVSVRFPRSDDVMECLLDVHHRKWTS